jgi:hypothetical protein
MSFLADPGTLKRAPFCEVFEKQYITCKIFATNIATAIQNGYEPKFKFNETTYSYDTNNSIMNHSISCSIL